MLPSSNQFTVESLPLFQLTKCVTHKRKMAKKLAFFNIFSNSFRWLETWNSGNLCNWKLYSVPLFFLESIFQIDPINLCLKLYCPNCFRSFWHNYFCITAKLPSMKLNCCNIYSNYLPCLFAHLLSIHLPIHAFVCLSICLAVCPSLCSPISLPAHLSVCLSVCPSVCLSVCPSVRLSVCPSVRLSVCPSVRLPVCLSVRLSICLSVCLSICPSVRLSICPSVRLSVCLSVCLSVHPSIYTTQLWEAQLGLLSKVVSIFRFKLAMTCRDVHRDITSP